MINFNLDKDELSALVFIIKSINQRLVNKDYNLDALEIVQRNACLFHFDKMVRELTIKGVSLKKTNAKIKIYPFEALLLIQYRGLFKSENDYLTFFLNQNIIEQCYSQLMNISSLSILNTEPESNNLITNQKQIQQ